MRLWFVATYGAIEMCFDWLIDWQRVQIFDVLCAYVAQTVADFFNGVNMSQSKTWCQIRYLLFIYTKGRFLSSFHIYQFSHVHLHAAPRVTTTTAVS